ncbi:hypothetical protein ACFQ0T_35970 [Kitasatospora gansuensis]
MSDASSARPGRRGATYVPLPGRVTTTPSAASWAIARDTVTGPTP